MTSCGRIPPTGPQDTYRPSIPIIYTYKRISCYTRLRLTWIMICSTRHHHSSCLSGINERSSVNDTWCFAYGCDTGVGTTGSYVVAPLPPISFRRICNCEISSDPWCWCSSNDDRCPICVMNRYETEIFFFSSITLIVFTIEHTGIVSKEVNWISTALPQK